ncbi:MAG: DUF1800 domain-containing protein [Thermoanaerobaculia bacterium]
MPLAATPPRPPVSQIRTRRDLFLPLAAPAPAAAGVYSPATAMRKPPAFAEAPMTPPALPPIGVVALNRAGFGPRPGEVDAFNALGANDTARLTAWVDQQLNPGAIDDTDCNNRIAAAGYATLNKTSQQLFQDHYLADPPDWEVHIQPALESELATWTRAVYSKRQLFEAMVHFWHNHFNVYAYEFIEGPMWIQYDRDVIRANALGNFRTLVEKVTKSPSMLVYLDNFLNFSEDGTGYSNENFARELIELHTIGAVNSFGNTPRNQIPLDGQGRPIGYCEDDVKDMARALTGWTFDIDWIWQQPGTTGDFVYRDDLHNDLEAKIVLGVNIAAGGTAAADGGAALDAIVNHPACAQFVAKKLCRRLVADFPSQSLVDGAAAVFTANLAAPDQIAKVVRYILLSNDFKNTWGEKIKRPFEIAVSALRAGNASWNFHYTIPYPADWDQWGADMQDTSTLHWIFEAGNQEIFGWHPPNGHPDVRGAWQSASPRVALWRTSNWLIDIEYNTTAWRLDALAQTPANVRSANQLTDFWIQRIFNRALPDADRSEIVQFMAQGHNPDLALPLDTDEDTQDRLRSMVGLLFMSPEFLWR